MSEAADLDLPAGISRTENERKKKIDIAPTNGIAVQGLVFSNNPNVHVTGEIIDVATGEVQGIIAILIAL